MNINKIKISLKDKSITNMAVRYGTYFLYLFKDMMDFQSSAFEQCGVFSPFLLEVLGLAWEPVRTRPLLWEAVLKYTVRPRRGNLETL